MSSMSPDQREAVANAGQQTAAAGPGMNSVLSLAGEWVFVAPDLINHGLQERLLNGQNARLHRT
jgi:hypothetical protein